MPSELQWSQLTIQQQDCVRSWLPQATLEEDLSWGLVDTTVVRAAHDHQQFIIKAGGPKNHHIGREIAAHHQWLYSLTNTGHVPRLLHADREANLLVTYWLPGLLIQGTPAALSPETHHQAGVLLARLHREGVDVDVSFEASANAKTLAWLEADHAIPRSLQEALRSEVLSWPTGPTEVVPTHGDYHPRNWLVDRGEVAIIDFGRAAMRPAASDLVRLEQRDWRGRPELEAAFIDGYGRDPRQDDGWRRLRVREAVGTAVWARMVGDAAFEQEGLRLIAELMPPS